MNIQKNELGKCPCCGTEIAEPKTQYGFGHKLEGQMKTLKRWHDHAIKGVFITSFGSQVHITLCDGCINHISSDTLRDLWTYALNGMALEIDKDYRRAVGAEPLSKDQFNTASAKLKKMADETLVGLYCKLKV